MTIECAECGKEYDPDDLIDIGDKEIYFCECGYENVWVQKMTKEQKVIVHVELDPDLLEKIDREAEKDLRTRKAQVLYILKDHFNKQEEK